MDNQKTPRIWAPVSNHPDSYVLFRGRFSTQEGNRKLTVHCTGASWYVCFIDGQEAFSGPHRYSPAAPEYQVESFDLSAGEHVIAFMCHYEGVETRILRDISPHLQCGLLNADKALAIEWKCMVLDSQWAELRRVNPQLGWIEWRDTRLEPVQWPSIDFDDVDWERPVEVELDMPAAKDAGIAPLKSIAIEPTLIASGALATTFGYQGDDPSLTFFTRDRVCELLPAKGVWRRYDLGRIRLGRFFVTLDIPAGAVVEIGVSEFLTNGSVCPTINFSLGASCNMDHFVARGGVQSFGPITPKGGRFVEVHVLGIDSSQGEDVFLSESYIERCYHDLTESEFRCGDELLEKIWHVGVETYRSCAEDALIDNPTRERGEWVGDVVSVGMEIASVSFHDLRLCRRALFHAAICAREDGLVAGMAPGGCIYLPTYAFQWQVAVMNYFRHTADLSVLEELWAYCVKNMAAIECFLQEDGLHDVAGWNFVDWGYVVSDQAVDLACNLHYLWALRAVAKWGTQIDQEISHYEAIAGRIEAVLSTMLADRYAAKGWAGIGYHGVTLALHLQLIQDRTGALSYLKSHWLDCFPNNSKAPRNDDPMGKVQPIQLITPYFSHYVMPLFIEAGETDFVLDQYRKCWGWMLEEGRTTWVEVFDTRWSHAHQWSGCPTWQMSRYLLGLHPKIDEGAGRYQLKLYPGSLESASGRIPHANGGWIQIRWVKQADTINYELETDHPLIIDLDGELISIESRQHFLMPVYAPAD